jgi:hypothetical protein
MTAILQRNEPFAQPGLPAFEGWPERFRNGTAPISRYILCNVPLPSNDLLGLGQMPHSKGQARLKRSTLARLP